MKRITTTLPTSLYEKLPTRGKSAYVAEIIRQHYISKASDSVVAQVIKQIKDSEELEDWVRTMAVSCPHKNSPAECNMVVCKLRRPK